MKKDILFLFSLAALLVIFAVFHGPQLHGDTSSYVQALDVLSGAPVPAGFMPNRLLTTMGGLASIRALAPFAGGIYPAWLFLNLVLYVFSCIVFYRLLSKLFGRGPATYLGGMFMAANYGFMLFGLNYIMDIGGWAFYLFALYFLHEYSRTKKTSMVLLAALMVGVGGLFKEYAFLGGVAIGAYLIIEIIRAVRGRGMIHAGALRVFGQKMSENAKGAGGDDTLRPSAKNLAFLLLLSALIAVIPVAILYLYVYHRFGYTYLDWFGANAVHYVYRSRILEYIKALGSLMNLLGLLVIGGAVVVVRSWRSISAETKMFLAATLVSFLPIFAWPAITQRILTITVPFAVIVAGFMFKKYEHRWYLFLPVLVLYVLATFFMDSFILKAVNLPF